jgi:hypothetical protein
MKILYISGNQRSPQFPWLTDYQDDCLLLGLKELHGDDVVDCNLTIQMINLQQNMVRVLLFAETSPQTILIEKISSEKSKINFLILSFMEAFGDVRIICSLF